MLVDERDLWPAGEYVTTHLIVRTSFLEEHPGRRPQPALRRAGGDRVHRRGRGTSPAGRERRHRGDHRQANHGRGDHSRGPNLQFTVDLIASSLQKSADDVIAAGLLDEVDLSGIYSVDLLNEVLADTGPRRWRVCDARRRTCGGVVDERRRRARSRGTARRAQGVRSGQDAVVALDGIDLDVSPGQLLCLVGASGCGKTTLLNLNAGLDAATAGSVTVDGRTALMFQEAALFPWLTVARNVEPAGRRGVPRERAPPPSGAVARPRRPGRVRWPASARAVRRMRQRVALARVPPRTPTCSSWTSRSGRSTR